MARYTIIMDWEGGTYLAQACGRSVHEAVRAWAEQLDVDAIPGLGEATKARLVAEVAADSAVPIEGLAHVWCSSACIRGKLALMHVVRTA